MASPKQPLGISYPITHGPQGYFNQSWTTADVIKNQIVTLLSTRKGERRMNVEFGSSVWNLVFEFNNDELSTIIDSAIRNDVHTWLPNVEITNVEINNSSDLRDKYRVEISVSFIAPTSGVTTEQTVSVSITQGNT